MTWHGKRRFSPGTALLTVLVLGGWVTLHQLHPIPHQPVPVTRTATVQLGTSAGAAGSQIAALGEHWPPGDTVAPSWSDGTDLWSAAPSTAATAVGADGTFYVIVTIPPAALVGTYTITFQAVQQQVAIAVPFTVTN